MEYSGKIITKIGQCDNSNLSLELESGIEAKLQVDDFNDPTKTIEALTELLAKRRAIADALEEKLRAPATIRLSGKKMEKIKEEITKKLGADEAKAAEPSSDIHAWSYSQPARDSIYANLTGRGHDFKVIQNVYPNKKVIDITVAQILLRVQHKMKDHDPSYILTDAQVDKIMQFANKYGGVSSKLVVMDNGDQHYIDMSDRDYEELENAVSIKIGGPAVRVPRDLAMTFSAEFQKECRKVGIYSGRYPGMKESEKAKTRDVGSRSTFLWEGAKDDFNELRNRYNDSRTNKTEFEKYLKDNLKGKKQSVANALETQISSRGGGRT
jgi:hypothetical protein